jgi:hypothetical protein
MRVDFWPADAGQHEGRLWVKDAALPIVSAFPGRILFHKKVRLPMVPTRTWTLNKVLVLVLSAGFALLVVDLRYEHVGAVRHYWQAWIPIVYSGVMVVLGAAGLAGWERGGRQALRLAFAAAFLVGGLGFWLHNNGDVVSGVLTVLSAWTGPLHHEDVPPPLAPLSFTGLGLLGTLACARRFQPQ